MATPAPRPGLAPLAPSATPVQAPALRVVQPRPSPVGDLTRQGLTDFAAGNFESAAQAFRAVTEAGPHQVIAWNNLALALVALGELEEALSALRRSLDLDPEQLATAISLANVLLQMGRGPEAEDACDTALSLEPDSSQAWHIRAIARAQREDFAGAAEAFDRTIELGGEDAALCANLGATLMKSGRFREASLRFADALSYDPTSAATVEIKQLCDFILAALAGDMAMAKAVYPGGLLASDAQADRVFKMAVLCLGAVDETAAVALVAADWAQARPDNLEASHLRDAALSRSVERQPPQLVAQHFDAIAEDFDDRLVGRLGYSGPDHIEALLSRWLPAAGALAVLDAGCGTGLCAAILRPYAHRLTGLDLSPKMLAKAQARGLYDRLDCADLLVALGDGSGPWDLIVAADTLPYLGALEDLFDGAAAALSAQGWFAFTTESADIDVYVLLANGRYAHGHHYIAGLADGRFEIVEHVTAMLRREGGRAVEGGFYLLRRVPA